MYIGRFAPTPSGPLHFGSIVTAIASFLDAKFHRGKWLLKIDDLDHPRIAKGAENSILKALENLGLKWDGEIIHQSQRIDSYQYYLDQLQKDDLLYKCNCSRKNICMSGKIGLDGIIYDGTCRQKLNVNKKNISYRIKVNDVSISLEDKIQGKIKQNLTQDIGDFIVRRSDQIFAYQFAVSIDNQLDKITHLCRGYDLINSLHRQYYLHKLLNFNFPISIHIPTITKNQKKLSKGHGNTIQINRNESLIWINALEFLGQPIDDYKAKMSVEEILQEALVRWSLKSIPKLPSLGVVEHIHT